MTPSGSHASDENNMDKKSTAAMVVWLPFGLLVLIVLLCMATIGTLAPHGTPASTAPAKVVTVQKLLRAVAIKQPHCADTPGRVGIAARDIFVHKLLLPDSSLCVLHQAFPCT